MSGYLFVMLLCLNGVYYVLFVRRISYDDDDVI